MQDEQTMKPAVLVFPHQLFEENPACADGRDIFLIEEYLYFSQYRFHKQKIAFHRASMNFYKDYLQSLSYSVHYIEAHDERADCRKFIRYLKENNYTDIHYVITVDDWLERRLQSCAEEYNLKLHKYQSPLFLNSEDDNASYFSKKKKYFQTQIAENKERPLEDISILKFISEKDSARFFLYLQKVQVKAYFI